MRYDQYSIITNRFAKPHLRGVETGPYLGTGLPLYLPKSGSRADVTGRSVERLPMEQSSLVWQEGLPGMVDWGYRARGVRRTVQHLCGSEKIHERLEMGSTATVSQSVRRGLQNEEIAAKVAEIQEALKSKD